MKETGIAIVVCVIMGAVVMYGIFFMSSRAQRIRSEQQIVITRQTQKEQQIREELTISEYWQKAGITQYLTETKEAEKTPKYKPRPTTEATLRRVLYGYLMNISEVRWVEFGDNTVYIGFDPYPFDGNAILRGAAFAGNEAINFGCHVWAVPASQTNRTSVDRFYDEVTVRYGRVE